MFLLKTNECKNDQWLKMSQSRIDVFGLLKAVSNPFSPPASAVEVIESVPSFCLSVCLCFCLCVCHVLMICVCRSIMAKGLWGEGTLQHGSLRHCHLS